MIKYYKIKVQKIQAGLATEYVDTPVNGEIIASVMDNAGTRELKVVVVDCTNEQHESNVAGSDIVEISDAEATALSAKFQPGYEIEVLNVSTNKLENVKIENFNLQNHLFQTNPSGIGGHLINKETEIDKMSDNKEAKKPSRPQKKTD